MLFLKKELILATQEKFYQIQLSQKQKTDSESLSFIINCFKLFYLPSKNLF